MHTIREIACDLDGDREMARDLHTRTAMSTVRTNTRTTAFQRQVVSQESRTQTMSFTDAQGQTQEREVTITVQVIATETGYQTIVDVEVLDEPAGPEKDALEAMFEKQVKATLDGALAAGESPRGILSVFAADSFERVENGVFGPAISEEALLAMSLGPAGNINGGTTLIDGLIERSGGGGALTDNCIDYALDHLLNADPSGRPELWVYAGANDEPGHAVLVIDGQAYDPVTGEKTQLPETERIGVLTQTQARELEIAAKAALADGEDPAAAVRERATELGIPPALLEARANDAPRREINTEAELAAAMATGDLSNCDINVAVRDKSFTNMNLRGATFNNLVLNSQFYGAHLEGAKFNACLNQVNFMYSHLEGADFSLAGLDRCNFAFATIDASTILDPSRASRSVFTDTLPGHASISPLMLNTPAIRTAVTGTSDPVKQAQIIRQLAAAGQLFPALRAALPAGTMDRLLPREFRSIIYEAMRHHGLEFPDKSFAFDDADEHWTDDYWSMRPAGGPTLQWLWDRYPQLHADIDRALAAALLTNAGGTLANPIGNLITGGWRGDPYANFNLTFAQNIAGAAALGIDPSFSTTPAIGSFSAWKNWVNTQRTQAHEWNGRNYQHGDVMIPWDVVDTIRTRLTGSTLTAFQAIAADGVVSINQLAALSPTDYERVLRAIYDIYGGR